MSWIHVSDAEIARGKRAPRARPPSLKAVVAAYIACGKKCGFALAEAMLDHFTPAGVLEGKCYHVPAGRRAAFMAALKDPTAYLERIKVKK